MVHVGENREFVNRILSKHGIPLDWVHVVSDVQAWCRERSVEEDHPFRAAKCFYKLERCCIVIADEQTDDMILSAKSQMAVNGFATDVAKLDSDLRYLEHLVLHEIAAFKLQTSEQDVRDEWAFEQLARDDA